ncbi:hypothetical protein CVT25_009590 [Psilocybe cyanescens]|uniref:Uncharacterized protein n=1 Tax=Psilocybe cyanescens TaxID=93625 RepID=A0A409XV22_PSICY|nr:hypothetical protein CVT25_009590 [Psilocybe cyanescens]
MGARPPKIKAQNPWDGMGLGPVRNHDSAERAKDLSESYAVSGSQSPLSLTICRAHIGDTAGEEVEGSAGWGWVGYGCECGRGDWEVTTVMRVDRKGGYLKEGQGKEGLGQVKVKTEEKENWRKKIGRGKKDNKISHKPSSPSPSLVIPHAPMSTTPASAFTSSSALTSTAHSNAHLPSSSPSAIATAMFMRPTAPSKVAPMATEEDEGNMEAGRRLIISQPERAGSVVTMLSAYSSNGTRSRSGTLNLTGGSMLASPGAFGSGTNDGEWGAVACMPAPVHDNGGDVAGDKEEKKEKEKKKSKKWKEKDDGRKKDGKREKEAEKENTKA